MRSEFSALSVLSRAVFTRSQVTLATLLHNEYSVYLPIMQVYISSYFVIQNKGLSNRKTSHKISDMTIRKI